MWHASYNRGNRVISNRGGVIKTFTVSLLGAVALATGLLLIRQQREVAPTSRVVPPGESIPSEIHLERLRELGI